MEALLAQSKSPSGIHAAVLLGSGGKDRDGFCRKKLPCFI